MHLQSCPHRLRVSSAILTVLAVAAVCLAGVVGRTRLWAVSSWSETVHNSAAPADRPPAQLVKVVLFTLTPQGFSPGEVELPAGRYVIAVNNRTRLQEVSLQFDRVAGQRLKDVRVTRGQLDWRGTFDLTPGQYRLTEAAKPDWAVVIRVTAR
jgi:hypothetical protein